MKNDNHCYECGRASSESQPTVFADCKAFHRSCTITLQWYDCRRLIGYQVKVDSSPNRIYILSVTPLIGIISYNNYDIEIW